MVNYLQSIGVKFGQHLNAYTSFDESFFLPIPSDDKEKVKKVPNYRRLGIQYDVNSEEIDKERGVVLEEYP